MPERILIVDDSRSFRQSLARFLEMEGFEVVEAEIGSRGSSNMIEPSPI